MTTEPWGRRVIRTGVRAVHVVFGMGLGAAVAWAMPSRDVQQTPSAVEADAFQATARYSNRRGQT